MRLAVAVAAQSCNHLYRAVPSHRLVDMLANARKRVGILKYLTIAIKMMRLVPNAHSLWRSGVCAERRLSRISSAGCQMFAAATSAATSFAVVRISVLSLAIVQESAKIQTAKPVSSLVASPKRLAGIQMRTHAMRPSHAKKRSPAKAKSLSLATARRRSKR
jgi:hypothetical protein